MYLKKSISLQIDGNILQIIFDKTTKHFYVHYLNKKICSITRIYKWKYLFIDFNNYRNSINTPSIAV
jgi:hypothetical protein